MGNNGITFQRENNNVISKRKVMAYGDQKHTDQRYNKRGTDPHHTGGAEPVRRSLRFLQRL